MKMKKWMDERRLTKDIYEADVGGNAGRGRPRRSFRERPGQKYPKPTSVYEESDDSRRSERCVKGS
jgi:hypothetical protein